MTPISPITNIPAVFHKFNNSLLKNNQNDNNVTNILKKGPRDVELSQTMPWLQNKALEDAIIELRELKFEPEDIKYLKNMGVSVPFKSGADAVKFIERQNIRILFDKPSEEGIHAQYDFGKNIITINDRYKTSIDFPVILAIAEAILHETGHAKDNDGESSVQEEIDCLGMNAIAHRAFLRKYGDIFSDANEPIIKDGVSVYAKLFFEPDPWKNKLIQRIKEKYGDLASGDRVHPPGPLARSIKRDIPVNQIQYHF